MEITSRIVALIDFVFAGAITGNAANCSKKKRSRFQTCAKKENSTKAVTLRFFVVHTLGFHELLRKRRDSLGRQRTVIGADTRTAPGSSWHAPLSSTCVLAPGPADAFVWIPPISTTLSQVALTARSREMRSGGGSEAQSSLGKAICRLPTICR